jgi:hypothetical protein
VKNILVKKKFLVKTKKYFQKIFCSKNLVDFCFEKKIFWLQYFLVEKKIFLPKNLLIESVSSALIFVIEEDFEYF